MDKVRISVEPGDDPNIVTIRLSGRSKPIVAGVLGVEGEDGDIQRYYLDCLVHHHQSDKHYEGWRPTGAISTILSRIH